MDEKGKTLNYDFNSQRDDVNMMARRQMRDLALASEILTLPDMTGYLLVPGGYPIARVKCGYAPTGKQANGFIECDSSATSFEPVTTAAVPIPAPSAAEAQQPVAPEQGNTLDDNDMDAPATVGVMHNENGDVTDKITGEIIEPTEKASCVKDDADAKSAGQDKKPNPLADVL